MSFKNCVCTGLCAFVSHLDDLGDSNVDNVGCCHYHLHIPILVELTFNFHPIWMRKILALMKYFTNVSIEIHKVVAINRHFSDCPMTIFSCNECLTFYELMFRSMFLVCLNTTNRIDSNLFKSITQERNKHSNIEIIINRSHLASPKDRWFNVYNVAPCVSHGIAWYTLSIQIDQFHFVHTYEHSTWVH